MAGGPMSVHQALLFRQWSADVTFFSHLAPPTDEDAERLAARAIPVVDVEVASLEVVEDRLVGARLRATSPLPGNRRKEIVMSEEFDKAYWEERYRGHPAGARPPNPQLVAEAAELAPGSALDAGCGEGADATWLAAHGWRVTAVDIAATALRRAREHAEALGPEIAGRIEWVEADLTAWTPARGTFALVSAQYVHPAAARATLPRRLADAVAPGGTLLVVGHHPSDRHCTGSHAPAAGSQITAEEVAACLDAERWDIVHAEARRHTGSDPHGHEITMIDAVLRARKRP